MEIIGNVGEAGMEGESTWSNDWNGRAFGKQCGNLLQRKLPGIYRSDHSKDSKQCRLDTINQPSSHRRLLVVGLGNLSSHKIFNLQSVLSVRCIGVVVEQEKHSCARSHCECHPQSEKSKIFSSCRTLHLFIQTVDQSYPETSYVHSETQADPPPVPLPHFTQMTGVQHQAQANQVNSEYT